MRKIANSTGFRGIYKHRETGKYETRVTFKQKAKTYNIYVGLYGTIPEAVAARQEFITNLL